MCFRAKYNKPADIKWIIQELEEKERYEIVDFVENLVSNPYDFDYEAEEIEIDDHDSESKEETKRANEEDVKTKDEHFWFYIEKDRETL